MKTMYMKAGYIERSWISDKRQLMPKSVFTPAYALAVEHLIALRNRHHLTQDQVGERLGRPQQFVSLVEQRGRRLDVIEYCVFVRALGGDPEAELVQLVRKLPENIEI